MEKETIIRKFQVPEVGIPVLDVMLTAAEQELIAAFPEGKELRKEELADLADGMFPDRSAEGEESSDIFLDTLFSRGILNKTADGAVLSGKFLRTAGHFRYR